MSVTRYLGFAEETEFGVAVPAVEYVDPESAEIDPSGDQAIIWEGISRLDRKAAPGRYTSEGSFAIPVDMKTIGWFLKWTLGGYNVTGDGTTSYTHSFTPSLSNLLTSFTARVGKDVFEHVFSGCVVSTLSLELEDSFLTASIDVLGGKDEKASLQSSVAFTDGEVFAPHQVDLSVDGADESATVETFTLTIENGADNESGHTIGTRFPRRAFRGALLVELELGLSFFDTSHLERFWGTASAPTEGNALTSANIAINIGQDMEIMIPNGVYTSIEQPVGGRDRIEQTAIIRGLMAPDGTGPVEISLTNDVASYTVGG